jgi:hypothetical protein
LYNRLIRDINKEKWEKVGVVNLRRKEDGQPKPVLDGQYHRILHSIYSVGLILTIR